ncbi:hypothetical protein StrepF001_39630 [Streptomyces sp. F001]|uniref:hypothetical protein n=1 Tax=Streptomyces sp. F001 TaxID=1510026 RepID=UPI00101E391B|nr:hypothetical protein [Streptomyces sp. F001]RZB14209.1 hypothetical protein StrepF001_39630 [Streptomyces sp. F001]
MIERHRIGLDEARPQAVSDVGAPGTAPHARTSRSLRPGRFTEYGALVIAAQRQRRSLDDLIAQRRRRSGRGHRPVNGEQFGADRSQCVVMSYDYTVLAGTQGS